MARGDITIRKEVRPCKVMVWVMNPNEPNEEMLKEVDAIWHQWRDDGREAIVELENGMVRYAAPDKIRFLDSIQLFREQMWEESNENRNASER